MKGTTFPAEEVPTWCFEYCAVQIPDPEAKSTERVEGMALCNSGLAWGKNGTSEENQNHSSSPQKLN